LSSERRLLFFLKTLSTAAKDVAAIINSGIAARLARKNRVKRSSRNGILSPSGASSPIARTRYTVSPALKRSISRLSLLEEDETDFGTGGNELGGLLARTLCIFC